MLVRQFESGQGSREVVERREIYGFGYRGFWKAGDAAVCPLQFFGVRENVGCPSHRIACIGRLLTLS